MTTTLSPDRIADRLSGIGGSDAAAVAGLSPWKTAAELYYEKRGEIEPPPPKNKEAVHFGIVLEDIVAREYARRTRRKVRRVNRLLRHPDHPWMIASLDRDVVGAPRILECKTAGFNVGWGPEGSDEVPDHYLLQCQHYLGVTGAEIADLAVLIGGQTFRIFEIHRDDALIHNLVDIESGFWARVQDGIPPDPDWSHRTTGDLMQRLYPGTDGTTLAASEDEIRWHQEYQGIKEKAKHYGDLAEAYKVRLRAAMGESAALILPDGTGYRRKKVTRAGYTVQPAEYIDFRYIKRIKQEG